ncbi:xanthine dehydrogenase family protein molybdopterin-binding subunit [Halodurantibacterium flavum]|uniref:Molybdopterin cofactor-binding domain-containing protein n=1 Tax=Halodurantibacterium flavum TaxID=1382802 RepID=A0ABW4S1D3_9RHOB
MPRFLTRRGFLVTGAALGGTALVAGVAGVAGTGYLATVDVDGLHGHLDGESAVLNAFVVIREDGHIVIMVPKTEMGQGIHTGLAMIVAEELRVPLDDRLTVEHPTEAHPAYANWANVLQIRPEEASGPVPWVARRLLGQLGFITTGASSSMMNLWHPMRVAGAAAREMLLAAGAAQLGVPVGELVAIDGQIRHASSNRALSFGELARAAAVLDPPSAPRLTPPSEWRLIGRSQPRLDLPAKIRGEPVFGMDVTLPDMVHASVRHAPAFGAGVARVRNEREIRDEPGVLDVVVISERQVAVVAQSWWQAEQAAFLLDVEWTQAGAEAIDSAALSGRLLAALDSENPFDDVDEGDVDGAMSSGGPVIESRYRVPFVTHACMEPMNATVLVREDGTAEGWVPAQTPMAITRGVARGAGWAGVTTTEVTPHVTMNGGAFGRRSDQDVVNQAAFLAARMPGRPVKVIWSREEDISRGLYRTHAAANLRAALGEDGLPVAYDAIVAAQSVIDAVAGRNLPISPGPDGDRITIEGLDKSYYAFANRRTRSVHVPSHVPTHIWRSNGYFYNNFFSESFMDECADAAGIDPLEYRRRLLHASPRHLRVLDRVAEMAGWGMPLAPGRGRGISIDECYRSVVAQVAEVTVAADGKVRVDRVFCAIDCGIVVNPDTVVAQMEGGIVFGVTTALMSEITFDRGAAVESNFHDFPLQRLADAPAIDVAIVQSGEPPCGVGEPGVVPTAAAVANAIFAATGRRLRTLPLAVTETIGERRTRSVLRTEDA